MGYISDATIAALRGSYNLGLFFRLGTTPPLRLAFSINDVPITLPTYDPDGVRYLGAGRFLSVPDLELLINGKANRVAFQLNGLTPEIVDQCLTVPVLGALATVGIAVMDDRWQPISQIIGLWSGTADTSAMDMPADADITKNRTMSLIVNCAAGDTSRALPSLVTASDETQKARYPTDRFFECVKRYMAGLQIKWPVFS